jgi:hypothetical protein
MVEFMDLITSILVQILYAFIFLKFMLVIWPFLMPSKALKNKKDIS